jgi:vacuolar-type H+-ATPase subunit E/Vma4
MSAIDELAASIIADARLQAGRIDKEADAEVERINNETERLVRAQQDKLLQAAKQQQQEIVARIEAKQELAAHQEVLQAKQHVLDDVFRHATAKLYKLSGAKRKELLKHLLNKASRQIRIGGIVAARHDARSLKVKGVKVTTAEGHGGFVAKSKDGKVRVDMRFETLLSDVRSRKTAEIAKILFGESKRSSNTPKASKRKSAVKRKSKRASSRVKKSHHSKVKKRRK